MSTIEDVKAMLCSALETPNAPFTGNESLAELGAWDSLAVLNLMAAMDARYGITLSPDKILHCETVRDLATLVREYRE